MWLIFPSWCDTEDLVKYCKEHWNLVLGYGPMFEVWGDNDGKMKLGSRVVFKHAMRLCWAFEEEENLVEGVTRLQKALVKILDSSKKDNRYQLL
jgi:DNA-binding transcriptional MocR family regulator